MNISYACPACDCVVHEQFGAEVTQLTCSSCAQQIAAPAGAVVDERVMRCLVCPSSDLYVRKDFPQRVGVGLVAVGIVGSSIAWYFGDLWWTFGILFATALVDVLLYALVGNALMCYRCGAIYRGVSEMDAHGEFDLETHERHRQLTARLKASPSGEPAT